MVEQGNGLTVETIARIDALFDAWNAAHSPGCALGIYREGERLLTRSYGMANLEHNIPIDEHSVFHVASISKQFTALCIAMLAEDGALGLDDDVRVHVPELPDFGPTITLRHLLHHTSGLRDQWDLLDLSGWRDDDLVTAGDVLDISVRQQALNFPPGQYHRYSNTGYTLLAVIVQRVSGLSLRQFAQERIFGPLGMTRTHFHDNHREIVPGRTQAYEPREAASGELPWVVSNPVFDVVGTTSLFTTVHDLFAWDQNFEHGRVGGALRELCQTPGRLNSGAALIYAFGLQVHDWRGLRVIEHSGGDAGYRAHYMRFPEHRLGIAILCNLSAAAPGQLAQQIAELLLAEHIAPSESAEAVMLSEEELRAVVGIYRNVEGEQLVQVVLRDGQLSLSSPFSTTLVPLGPDRFRTEGLRQLSVDIEREALAGNQGLSLRADDDVLFTFERVADSVPAARPGALQRLAGTYWSDELLTAYTFEVDGENLRWRRRKFEPVTLERLLPNTFNGRGLTFEFTPDKIRAGDELRVSTTRASGMRFSRR